MAFSSTPSCQLRLYVAGEDTATSRATIANLRHFQKEYLDETVELEIVDLKKHPNRSREDQIVATPTLLWLDPPPAKRLVGDLSDINIMLAWFGLQTHRP